VFRAGRMFGGKARVYKKEIKEKFIEIFREDRQEGFYLPKGSEEFLQTLTDKE
jgi:hypothetical protein